MKPDLELETWRRQWQSDTEVPADLRRKVAQGSRNMRLMVALEVLVTIGMGGGFTGWAARVPRTEMWVLAAMVWLFLAAAWSFAIVNRRGTWAPVTVSTAEFVELSIRRCRRRLAAASFGAVLYFAEMAFCLIWLYRDPARRQPLPAIIFGIATPLFLVGLRLYRRKTRAELAGLLELTSDR